MNDIVCISPVDGSVVARRRIATDPEVAQTLAAARQAQREWSRVPLAERKAKVLAFLAKQVDYPQRLRWTVLSAADELFRAAGEPLISESAARPGGTASATSQEPR